MGQELTNPVTTGQIDPGARLFMTPEERKVAETVAAAVARGEDPYGDDNTSVYTAAELREMGLGTDNTIVKPVVADSPPILDPLATPAVVAPVEAPVVPPATAEVPAVAPVVVAPVEAPAAVAEVIDPEDPTGLAKMLVVPLPSVPFVDERSFEQAKADLRVKISAIEQDFEDGKITTVAARNEVLIPLQQQLEGVNLEHAAAVGDQRATRRMVQQITLPVIDQIKRAGARDGLKYGVNEKGELLPHSVQYDMALDGIAADPDRASLSWMEKARLADAAVRTINGVKLKSAPAAAPVVAGTPPAAAAPATRAAPATPPTTLREMPAAGRPSEQGETLMTKLQGGNASQRDTIYGAMTEAQRANFKRDLDS